MFFRGEKYGGELVLHMLIYECLVQSAERAAGREVQGPAGASGCAVSHPFGWRDAMDIIVKWRQLSEPNDQARSLCLLAIPCESRLRQ